MNRKIITGLIVLMGISILGIIAVQLIWITNAFRIRNEQFDRSVSEALHQTVNRLEKIHDVMVINHLTFSDTLKGKQRILTPLITWKAKNRTSGQQLSRNSLNENRRRMKEQTKMEVRIDSGRVITYGIHGYTEENTSDSARGSSSQQFVFLRNDTLRHYDSLFSKGKKVLDSMTVLIDSSDSGRNEMNRKILIRTTGLRDLANKAVSEIKLYDNPRLNRLELEEILKEELNNRNIPILFQYGVFRDSSLLIGSGEADFMALKATAFNAMLYPNNLFQRNIRLSLYFPEREQFIVKSIGWLLAVSFIFSLIILLTFFFSVYFLLKQKKISEMKADFINNMTHEFKTPIATISVAADSILSEKVKDNRDKVEYFAAMIKQENQRMNRQVEDILTIARMEKRELAFKWEMTNVREIITEVADIIRIQVEQKGGQVIIIPDAGESVLLADRNHFSHALFNLLDNANKYSPEKPLITIKTSNRYLGIVISVSDKGMGISRQAQHKIFERFYRQQTGNVHNVKGFGLGLSYVKAVVEAHKGTISVESEPGAGSTFTLFFPFNYLSQKEKSA